MRLTREAVDRRIAECNWRRFFTQKHLPRQADGGLRYISPCYIEFFHAMGTFIGKEYQERYARTVRFWVTFEVLQQFSLNVSFVVGLVSLILAFFTGGQGWPEEIVTLALLLGMGPMCGMMFYLIWIRSCLDTIFRNAYLEELAAKQSDLTDRETKREWNWILLLSLGLLIFVGFYDSWMSSLNLILMGLVPYLFSLVEGLLLLPFIHIWKGLFSRKKSPKKTKKPLR